VHERERGKQDERAREKTRAREGGAAVRRREIIESEDERERVPDLESGRMHASTVGAFDHVVVREQLGAVGSHGGNLKELHVDWMQVRKRVMLFAAIV
jgi:hypothetical protein